MHFEVQDVKYFNIINLTTVHSFQKNCERLLLKNILSKVSEEHNSLPQSWFERKDHTFSTST